MDIKSMKISFNDKFGWEWLMISDGERVSIKLNILIIIWKKNLEFLFYSLPKNSLN